MDPFPRPTNSSSIDDLQVVLDGPEDLTAAEIKETALSEQQVRCIDLWDQFVRRVPADERMPSFPIWGDEIGASYPFETHTPSELSVSELREVVEGTREGSESTRDELLGLLPAYAKRPGPFPAWKQRFIRQNREWLSSLNGAVEADWLSQVRQLPPSLRKLEWNCKGDDRTLWSKILQFRPSGLRAKRFVSVPALVAMTTTQIPIIGPQRRYITRREALRLQGFADTLRLPTSRQASFKALGNAVHVGVVRRILDSVLESRPV
jgi:DNA (cytosine-5)-methyltransferase 1